jgi:hypothetical protein
MCRRTATSTTIGFSTPVSTARPGTFTNWPKAGASLWSWERDYVGGGAVDPQDRSVVYISAAIDPRDAAKLAHHEIFRGATTDGGSTWTWRPITRNSSVENLRPVVPQWYSGRTALVWCRGTMRNSQDYDMQIVGIIEPR